MGVAFVFLCAERIRNDEFSEWHLVLGAEKKKNFIGQGLRKSVGAHCSCFSFEGRLVGFENRSGDKERSFLHCQSLNDLLGLMSVFLQCGQIIKSRASVISDFSAVMANEIHFPEFCQKGAIAKSTIGGPGHG